VRGLIFSHLRHRHALSPLSLLRSRPEIQASISASYHAIFVPIFTERGNLSATISAQIAGYERGMRSKTIAFETSRRRFFAIGITNSGKSRFDSRARAARAALAVFRGEAWAFDLRFPKSRENPCNLYCGKGSLGAKLRFECEPPELTCSTVPKFQYLAIGTYGHNGRSGGMRAPQVWTFCGNGRPYDPGHYVGSE
jgi:hypothetical protein